MPTVYIDILFLVNLIIDYFLISAVSSLRRLKINRLRQLLSAAFGGLYSCLAFFPTLSPLYSVIGKIVVSAVMTLIAFPIKTAKNLFLNFACLHIASALFAGLVMGTELLFSPKNMLISNGEIYINISAFTLIIFAAAAYLLMLLFSRVFKLRRGEELSELRITFMGKTAQMTALFDSGNRLTDPLTGAKVIVVSLESVKTLVPRHVFSNNGDISLAEGTSIEHRVCAVPFSALSGKGVLPAFRPDKVEINGKEIYEKTVIAVKDGTINENYQALVGYC